MASGELNEVHLANIMKVFANPGRVRLLKILTRPHALGEIRLPAHDEEGPIMSRQAVTEHLQQLVAAGTVRQWSAEREGRLVQLYQVNHSQLFALTEKLRELGRIHPEGPTALDGTMIHAAPSARKPATNLPSLTALSGAREGARFDLRGAGPWCIGRAPEVEVSLDYDPFLSLENSRIRAVEGGFEIQTLPKSRNGTTINWEPLPPGKTRRLESGDVIGVGRTLLLWRPGANA